ncbi:MAG TPA: ATPase [Candidatus Korarchaeota archaeon]|nr:MAG: ATPase [Candidatus Korarchaeota archaeon]HDI74200.1 ATPase [Candidatus Korarchaeota archaeon]
MYVVKASGEREEFRPEKLMRSLIRAGASRELAAQIAGEVAREIWQGITTREILRIALEKLRERGEEALMLRYDLKRSIMNLGPSGYPFEKFIAVLLKKYGFKTRTNVVLEGKCVSQEVDVVAERDGLTYMVECKFHNRGGIKTDLKVAMYTYARFLDLKRYFDRAWLICNTKCTLEAIRYCKCVGIRNTSWAYPRGRWSLESLIERKGLYPVTILRSLDEEEKKLALSAGIVTVEDVVTGGVETLLSAGIGRRAAVAAVREGNLISKLSKSC